MVDRKKAIDGLKWVLEDDRFGFGTNWTEDSEPKSDEEQAGYNIQMAIAILKEQEAVEWINVKDKLPEKDGQYLVVYTFFDYRGIGVVHFSHNLHEIDEYIFNTENRPGWYEPDDEVGYFERTTVTHWAKLPEFPKEGR